jgi:hypothetical protein
MRNITPFIFAKKTYQRLWGKKMTRKMSLKRDNKHFFLGMFFEETFVAAMCFCKRILGVETLSGCHAYLCMDIGHKNSWRSLGISM